jgi:WD40 repeat protein
MAFLTEMWSTDNATQPQRIQTRRASVLCELLQGDDITPSNTRIFTRLQPENQLQQAPALHAVLWQMLLATKLPFATTKNTATPFNLRGLDFSAQRWRDLDLTQAPALDLRGANLRGMYLTHCKFGAVICDETTNASNAVFRECDTSQIAWNNAQRSGLMIRGKNMPRPAMGAPLVGSWTMPLRSQYIFFITFDTTGNQLAFTGSNGSLGLWDVHHSILQASLIGHERTVTSAAFNPNGNLLSSSGTDGTVRLWNTHTESQSVLLKGYSSYVNDITFNPLGNILASAWGESEKGNGVIRLWDLENKNDLTTLKGHDGSTYRVLFNPTESLLASAGGDGKVRLWDMKTKTEIAILDGHNRIVTAIAFSPDGDLLASAGVDGKICVWNVQTRIETDVISIPKIWLLSITFSPNGKALAVSGSDGSIHIWDIGFKSRIAEIKGHSDFISKIAFNSDGNLLASASKDGTIRLWDMTTLETCIANKQPFKPAYKVITPFSHAPFDPSWASFDGDGNLLDWSDSAVDHWLHVERNGRSAPIESVL